jgi:hypothetical protein
MRNRFSFINKLSTVAVLGVLFVSSACTKKFEEFNTDPYGISDNDLKVDFRSVGDPFKQAQLNIYSAQPAWLTQLQQNLIGDIYSGYMMTPTPFIGNSNNTTYDLVDGWNGFPWSTAYDQVMAPMADVLKKSQKEFGDFNAWAKIIKVEAMHRVSDIYGPIIYTKYGIVNDDGSVDYDSQQEAYNAFFSDLGVAIDTLTRYANSTGPQQFARFDLVYGGDYKKWVRFANTLRLRLAIRISKVDPAKAKTEGEKSLAHPLGIIADPADNFNVNIGSTTHPLNVMNNSWGDIRMGAPMETYLLGYTDPRVDKYFLKSEQYPTTYKGIREGIDISDKSQYVKFSLLATLPSQVQLMTAAEAWFLKAEAAIRGWSGAGTAQTDYENGVKASFAQYGFDASTYLQNGTSLPAPYVDPVNPANNVPAGNPNLSTITIKWNDAATFEQKLERIITQKWLAMYPDGQEAWSEFRRTGYPKLFPVLVNKSGGKIPSGTFIRRINFPSSEYSTNPKGVQGAVAKLGGPDNGGTRLWWDKP